MHSAGASVNYYTEWSRCIIEKIAYQMHE